MASPTTPNADLEQSLYKAKQKETRLRNRAVLAAILPVVAGGLWLLYSLSAVTTWQASARETEKREAELQRREIDSRQKVADADTKRLAAEALAQAAQDQEKAAKQHADDIQRHIVKVREEVGSLAPLLNDLSSAKVKAAKLMASEAVETQISEIRTGLGRSLGRIEQEIDKDLPESEQKARIYFYVTDDAQNAVARALVPVFQGAGFDVAPIAKNTTRRVDNTEVRYFHEPQDRAEAARIQGLIVKQTGQTDCRIFHAIDPSHASGSRKFQVWLGKPPPAAPR